MVSGQARSILLWAGPMRNPARTGLLKGLTIIPSHPLCRILGQFGTVFLELGEVVEGISVVQFAGMDQAHEQIAHPGKPSACCGGYRAILEPSSVLLARWAKDRR